MEQHSCKAQYIFPVVPIHDHQLRAICINIVQIDTFGPFN